MCSLGIEPTTFALLAQCSNHWATGTRDEWKLHPQTFQVIWGIFGRPELDLFASENNTDCQTYFSKDRDALAHDWPNLLIYASPLIALFPKVIREQKHRVLLVALLWRNQHWFDWSERARGKIPTVLLKLNKDRSKMQQTAHCYYGETTVRVDSLPGHPILHSLYIPLQAI